MFNLKPLSREAVPAALEKAVRYRLLNEPAEAESICHDVLSVDPGNQQALVTLLLALTDRFGKGYAVGEIRTQEVLQQIRDPYERDYYGGIVAERRAKALLQQGGPGCDVHAYEFLRDAMDAYERAESIRPAGNDDALLRWNACARMITQNKLTAPSRESVELPLE